MVARLDAGHALAHLHHDARPFVTQHHREQTLGVVTAQREGVGVAHTRVRDLHQHLTLLGRGHVDFNDLQGLACRKGHSGARFDHGVSFNQGAVYAAISTAAQL